MKKLLFAAVAIAAATAVHAQEARRPFGLGISIAPLEAAGDMPTIEVYAPINIAPNFRLEPSLGIRTHDVPSPGQDTRDVTLGVGAFFVQRVAQPFDLYMGGRLKLNFAHFENDTVTGTTSDSGTDVVVAAAIGGEHYFSAHMSLGAEAQLGYRSFSSASADHSDAFFTTGLAFLRFYF